MANGDIEVTSTAKSSTAVSTATSAVTTVTGAVGAAAAVSSIAGMNFGGGLNMTLPLANPLHKYASITHIFTLAALDTKSMNAPDMTYIKGGKLPIVLKTGGANPNNRVKTKFGKFDFYIDEVVIQSNYGFMQGTGNTNATGITMTVSEPLSMGMFPVALNQAAYEAGYNDFRSCIFLLKIEFKGADQNGNMVSVKNTTKYIPMNFRDLQMSVTEAGSVYKCEAQPAADIPLLASNCTITTDITITGSTVSEILQTGPKSLQAVINRRLQETAKNAKAPIADEVVILFPGSSDFKLTGSKPGEDEKLSGASAIKPVAGQINDATIFKELNVKRSAINQSLIESEINEIGASDLGYNEARQAKTPQADPNKAYDSQGYLVHSNTANPKICDYVFQQDSTIQNAINQVILTSDYAKNALKKPTDQNGMRLWWRIETALYHVDSKANFAATGRKPQISVYKVVPYYTHVSAVPIPGAKTSTFKNLLNQCVKVYNYIYTGKNSDILKFNLDFDNRFVTAITNDEFRNSASTALANQESKSKEEIVAPVVTEQGALPKEQGKVANPLVVRNATDTSSDKKGGGGHELPEHRAARVLHDALTFGQDLQKIEMDIVGDPYWLTGNGLGNYTAPDIPGYMNIKSDGSVNYQNGEVDMAINFRTPIDINPTTGLYNMAKVGSSQFSGIYKVQQVIHRFQNGQFTQTIKANRRQIEPKDMGNAGFDSKTTVTIPNPVDPATNGVNAQGQNVSIVNADSSVTNPETGEVTPAP